MGEASLKWSKNEAEIGRQNVPRQTGVSEGPACSGGTQGHWLCLGGSQI